jgi:4-phospho-D-threonate 3-dehydrogenase / 4-phospho-D-erythronate 3-dehydrogenase
MGDPAGIGPEIILKSISNPETTAACCPLVVGEAEVFRSYAELIGWDGIVRVIESPKDAAGRTRVLDCLDTKTLDGTKIIPGRTQPRCGQAAYAAVKCAVELCLAGEVRAVATAPINKQALKADNVPYADHTAMLAQLTNTHDPLTMFETRGLRVFFLSRHVPLRDACTLVKKDRVLDYLRRSVRALRQLGISDPHLAVAGLNPHGGEDGLFGDEEIREIAPAIAQARQEGLLVDGPVSPDSVFHFACEGRYDAVLSLYHDQGHIASKTLDFEKTIALTLGLPFLRTSVDHGTAFDIAGTGKASAVSMGEAIRLAAKYSADVSL